MEAWEEYLTEFGFLLEKVGPEFQSCFKACLLTVALMDKLKKYWGNEHINDVNTPTTEVNTIFATSHVTQKCKP